jgi:hypothetical protein
MDASKILKKQLRRGPRWKQKLGVVEELGQVSRRIARKRTIVALVGPPLQEVIYNIKGFKHFYSQKSSSCLEPGGGDRQGALCTGYPLVLYK